MGMYTEFVFGCELKEDTPSVVIDILKVIFGLEKGLPHCYDDDTIVFPPTRNGCIPYGASYYFAVHDSHSRMIFDKALSKTWSITIRCNIKNYENEIERFIDWLMPHISRGAGCRDFLGYTIYEESDTPRLYYLGDKAFQEC